MVNILQVHAASSSGSKCIIDELLYAELKNEKNLIFTQKKKQYKHFDPEGGDKMHLRNIGNIVHNHTV
jgi:hypothetical protein